MDDMSQTLGELLNDPKSMEQIRSLAGQLLGNDTPAQPTAPPDGIDTAKLMQLVGKLGQVSGSDEKLLYALRPHLSAPRQERLDTAVKFLKLAKLAPLLSDSGIF